MYIIRDIFHLKFGHFRDVKSLIERALRDNLLPQAKSIRILTDFTGDSYRLILEEGQESLGEFEQALGASMFKDPWQDWYKEFREHVQSSHREILKEFK